MRGHRAADRRHPRPTGHDQPPDSNHCWIKVGGNVNSGPEGLLHRPISHTETKPYLRNVAVPRCFERPSHIRWRRLNWLAEDAVLIEPVSAAKFPANREKYREFCRNGRSGPISASSQRVNSIGFSRIHYATEQGIFKRVSGHFLGISGNRFASARAVVSVDLSHTCFGVCWTRSVLGGATGSMPILEEAAPGSWLT